MSDIKRVLIVGGGYAGISVARVLCKKYKKRDDIEITIVDKNPFHTLMTELHEVAGMRTECESVQVPFLKIFGGTKVHIVTDTVVSIDFAAKEAVLSSSRLAYDHIVLGSGAQPDFFGIPGVKEHSLTLWSFADAIRIRRHLEDIWARAAAESDTAKRKNLLTFIVAGAGFTGIEMAGELLELKKSMCEKHHIDEKEVRVLVVEALGNILANLGESRRKKAVAYLEKKGCELMLNAAITEAAEGIISIKDGRKVEGATFIWTCGVMGSQFGASLGLESKRNRIFANANMRVEGKDNVWIAGDNLWFLENERPLPQIVETAHQTGEVVAHNIISAIDGGTPKAFKSNYHGFMVSIGGKYGVADVGIFKLSGFPAMAMKHMINLYYLFTIAGINQCWEYFKHEFLDIKDRRSIIGGFAEHKVRGYWPVLLRFWLGFSWVMEAVNKIGEGWLNFSLGSQSGWMFSKGVVQAGIAAASPASATSQVLFTTVQTDALSNVAASTGAAAVDATSQATAQAAGAATQVAGAATQWTTATVDATSQATAQVAGAATQVAGAVGQAATQWTTATVDATSQATAQVAGAATQAVTQTAHAANSAVRALGPFFDLTKSIFNTSGPVAAWFRTTFMDGLFVNIPFPVFQSMIVFTELGIGLALFGGAFTWWAAVASIGMCLVFTLSGMFRWDQLWFVFAAILCMGGAGRAFGLDYWIVRFAKKIWNGLKWVRAHHLYLDEPTK